MHFLKIVIYFNILYFACLQSKMLKCILTEMNWGKPLVLFYMSGGEKVGESNSSCPTLSCLSLSPAVFIQSAPLVLTRADYTHTHTFCSTAVTHKCKLKHTCKHTHIKNPHKSLNKII